MQAARERSFVCGILLAGGGSVLYVGLVGAGVPRPVAVGLVATICVLSARRVLGALPTALDGMAARHPVRAAIWALAAVVAVLVSARLAVFMLDPSRTAYATLPFSAGHTRHSCFSAYYEASRIVDAVPNVYDPALYTNGPKPRLLDGLQVDTYQYPPPFLFATGWLHAIRSDFLSQRAIWYCLMGSALIASFLALARWVGAHAGIRLGLLIVAMWLALGTQSALQFGNFHVGVFAMAMGAMVAFERGRNVAGGALLGFAVASKLCPGILLVYLAAQRKWRAVAASMGFVALFALAYVATHGLAPMREFVDYQAPRLANGVAFRSIQSGAPVLAMSFSLPGALFKLKLFGVTSGAIATGANLAAWLYTMTLIVIAFLRGRSPPGDEAWRPPVWAALLMLGSLRTPFVPQPLGAFAVDWVIILLAGREPLTAKRAVLLGAAFLIVNAPDVGAPLAVGVALGTVQQVVALLLAATVLRRPSLHPRPERTPPLPEP
jgi:Glycosyltransferase family 87